MGWGGLFHTFWEEGVRKPFRQIRRDVRRVWQRWTIIFGPSPSITKPTPPVSRASREAPASSPHPRWYLCTGRSSRSHAQVGSHSPSPIQEMRKNRRLRWLIDFVFIFALVSASCFLTGGPTSLNPSLWAMGLMAITGVTEIILLYSFMVWMRRRARRIAAWYQQDIFDLKEMGTPLQRHLQQHTQQKESARPESSKEEQTVEKSKEEIPLMAPLQVAETFLETHLFGPPRGRIRPITLERSHGLNLQDPTVQIALWLGGPCWWQLDPYSAVVLEHPQGHFRILQGPTFPQKVMNRRSPLAEANARIQKVIPQEFYSWGFERLRHTFRLHPYTVTIQDRWFRSREGIWVKVHQCRVRAVPDFRSPTFLETLCTLVRREAGKDGQTWVEEWLEALGGQSLLRQEVRAAVIGALNAYVRQHTLAQILHATPNFSTANTSTKGPRDEEDAFGLQVLRQYIEKALRDRGFRLKEVITFPLWEVPKRIQQRRKALQKQFRDLQRKEREIRETTYLKASQAWILDHTQGLIPIAREFEAGERNFLSLVPRALQVMLETLTEGLDFWERYQLYWYASEVLPDGPRPPFEDKGTFDRTYRELKTFATLMHLLIRRLPLNGI